MVCTKNDGPSSMSTDGKNRRWIICGDVVASIALLYVVYMVIFAILHPGPAGTPMPIQLKLLIADVVPGCFGCWWVVHRYFTSWSKKYPFFLNFVADDKRWRVIRPWLYVMVFISIAINFIRLHLGG